MMTELKSAREFLLDMSGGVNTTMVLCAVSGGMDSMCLLHLLSTWGRENALAVTAAHFNHQLRGMESDRDEAFVRDWCAEHDIPFVCGRGNVRALAAEKGLTLEEAAREARYAFLTQQQRALGCAFVLTAHHADDNAETMLLNLLRGTGIRGLTGIPEVRDSIARPFLHITREELAAYAAENGIPYVEDATNASDDVSRNILRHKVLPVLRELNPRAVENMARTAELLAEDETALTDAAEQVLAKCCFEEERAAILVSDLLCVKQALLSRCIRAMMARVCRRQKDLTYIHVEAVCDLLRGEPGREVSLPYGMTARREADTLVILRNGCIPKAISIQLREKISFGDWYVELSPERGEREISLPVDAELLVTAWRKEDRMTLPDSRGARSFKRLCAERGITPAQRDRLPVLRVNGKAAAAPGIGVDLDFSPQKDGAVFLTFHQNIEEK